MIDLPKEMPGGAIDDEVSLRDLDVSKIDREAVDCFLQSGSPGEASEVIEKLFDNIDPRHLLSALLRQYITVDIHIAAKVFAERIGVPREAFVESCGSVDEIARQLNTIDGTKLYLTNVLEQCIVWRRERQLYGRDSAIRRAAEYIDKNFAQEKFSLTNAAAAAGMTPTYFSSLFKKEMGISFLNYITRARMEKAKELLCCTSKSIFEVAGDVGYVDQHYFSHLFKRHTGQTPREFQQARNGKQSG